MSNTETEVMTEAVAEVIESVVTGQPTKKERKRSEYRTIAGKTLLYNQIMEAKKVYEEVQAHSEMCEKAVTLGLFATLEDASNAFKAPKGWTDVLALRKNVRLAISHRPEIYLNPLNLCKIAAFVADMIGDASLMISREQVKVENANDVAESE